LRRGGKGVVKNYLRGVVTGIVTKGVRSPDRGMRIMRMCGHLIGE
jgi:hypothetical protein